METNIRSVLDWLEGFRVALAEFPSEALTNINTPADLAACQMQQPRHSIGAII
jgi:hypothetical protein